MKPQSLTVRIWSNLLPRRLLDSTERTIAQCAWERKDSPWSPLTLALSPALSPETKQGNAIQKNCASKIKLIFAGNCLGFSGCSSCGGRSKCKGSLDAALAVMDLWFPKFNFPSQHLHQHYPSSFLSTDREKKLLEGTCAAFDGGAWVCGTASIRSACLASRGRLHDAAGDSSVSRMSRLHSHYDSLCS